MIQGGRKHNFVMDIREGDNTELASYFWFNQRFLQKAVQSSILSRDQLAQWSPEKWIGITRDLVMSTKKPSFLLLNPVSTSDQHLNSIA